MFVLFKIEKFFFVLLCVDIKNFFASDFRLQNLIKIAQTYLDEFLNEHFFKIVKIEGS